VNFGSLVDSIRPQKAHIAGTNDRVPVILWAFAGNGRGRGRKPISWRISHAVLQQPVPIIIFVHIEFQKDVGSARLCCDFEFHPHPLA